MDTSARTFVVRVYPGKASTVEEVRSGKRVAAVSIEEIGARIEALLASSNDPAPDTELRSSTTRPAQPVTND